MVLWKRKMQHVTKFAKVKNGDQELAISMKATNFAYVDEWQENYKNKYNFYEYYMSALKNDILLKPSK